MVSGTEEVAEVFNTASRRIATVVDAVKRLSVSVEGCLSTQQQFAERLSQLEKFCFGGDSHDQLSSLAGEQQLGQTKAVQQSLEGKRDAKVGIVASLREEVRLLGDEVQALRGLSEDLPKLRSDVEARLSVEKMEQVAESGQDQWELPALGASREAGTLHRHAAGVLNAEKGNVAQELQEHEQQTGIDSTKDEDSDLNVDPVPRTRTTMEMVEELEDELRTTYTLKESMWDVVMFLATPNLPHLGILDSIKLAFLISLNITVQVVFCAISWRAFTYADLDSDSIFSLKVWRLYFAHDVSHINELWPMTLASRVCEHDGRSHSSLILSGHQADLSQVIKTYRPDAFHNLGQLLCLLCLLILWTKLWSEANNSIKFMTAATTNSGKFSTIHKTLEGIKLISISYWRVAFIACVFVLRMTILVNLAVVATMWLSSTTSLGDLLLNALALELVLNVDELLFEGLAPDRALVFVRNLLPLPLWAKKQHGVDFVSMFGICAIIIVAPIVYYSLVAETLGLVNQAETALCQGARNFAYNVDQLGIVYIHDRMMIPSDTAFSEKGLSQTDHRIQAVNDVINKIPHEEWQYAIHEPDLTSLKMISLSQASVRKDELNRQCKDLRGNLVSANNSLPILAALRSATGNMSFDICSKENIGPYCYQSSSKPDTAMHLALLMCPESCGCTSVDSGTLVLSNCPIACVNVLQTNLLASNACQDADLKNPTNWKKWMQEAEFVAPSDLIASLQLEGCQALKKHPARNSICEGSAGEWNGLKPLTGLCPESCGCRTELEGAPKNCPNSCT